MGGGGNKINLADYVDVAERIQRFYEKHPEGSIQTEMVRLDGDLVVFRASVYRDRGDPVPTTGWAYEREGAGYVNKTSFIENCETSAIGRALANMGFAVRAGEPRPTRQEMEKVQRMGGEACEPNGRRGRPAGARKPEQRLADELQIKEIEGLSALSCIPDGIAERVRARLDAGLTYQQAADAIAYLRKLAREAGVGVRDEDGEDEDDGDGEADEREAAIRKLFARLHDLGWNDVMRKKFQKKHGIESIKSASLDDVNMLIAKLEEHVAGAAS